jgi:hypothetical protein
LAWPGSQGHGIHGVTRSARTLPRPELDEERRLHNPQKSIERIRERSGVDFQIRDIRRTVATRMAEDLGITPFIIAKVMDHKLPGEAEMGNVYNRYDYLAEKRQALLKWCEHLSRLVRRADRQGLRLVRVTPGLLRPPHGYQAAEPPARWESARRIASAKQARGGGASPGRRAPRGPAGASPYRGGRT